MLKDCLQQLIQLPQQPLNACYSTVCAGLWIEKLNLLNSVSIAVVGRVCNVKSYNKCSKCSLSALTQVHSHFATRLLQCRQYVVWTQPWNLQFSSVHRNDNKQVLCMVGFSGGSSAVFVRIHTKVAPGRGRPTWFKYSAVAVTTSSQWSCWNPRWWRPQSKRSVSGHYSLVFSSTAARLQPMELIVSMTDVCLCGCVSSNFLQLAILLVQFVSGSLIGTWSVCQCAKQEVKVIWQKAPHGGPIPRLGVTPGGRKLYHWIPGVGFPISVP